MTAHIRLLLADDQELIRSALGIMLELEDDFEVVASVGRGDEVVAAAKAHQPDVALLDIEMPGIDGLAVAGVLAQEVPQCRSLILTTFGRPGYLRRAMESGACGFVVKDAPPERLADAIRRVAAGQRVVDPALAATTLAAGASPLTVRERDVLVAARGGATVAEIAAKLFLSEGTVRNYLSAAIAKTGTRNRAEAVRTADERGLALTAFAEATPHCPAGSNHPPRHAARPGVGELPGVGSGLICPESARLDCLLGNEQRPCLLAARDRESQPVAARSGRSGHTDGGSIRRSLWC